MVNIEILNSEVESELTFKISSDFATLANTGQRYDYAAAVVALNAYFVPQVNSAFARQTFHQIEQRPGETVQQFATRLRSAAID